MIDDEPAGGAQAFRAKAGAVAVASQDQKGGALGRGDDLALDSPRAFQPGTGAP